jgi:hypothetical protein
MKFTKEVTPEMEAEAQRLGSRGVVRPELESEWSESGEYNPDRDNPWLDALDLAHEKKPDRLAQMLWEGEPSRLILRCLAGLISKKTRKPIYRMSFAEAQLWIASADFKERWDAKGVPKEKRSAEKEKMLAEVAQLYGVDPTAVEQAAGGHIGALRQKLKRLKLLRDPASKSPF